MIFIYEKKDSSIIDKNTGECGLSQDIRCTPSAYIWFYNCWWFNKFEMSKDNLFWLGEVKTFL